MQFNGVVLTVDYGSKGGTLNRQSDQESLEALIQEQERDERWGHRVFHEPLVALSLDGPYGENHLVSDFVSEDRVLLNRTKTSGCAAHGLGPYRKRSNGKLYCQQCHRESQRLRYTTDEEFRASVLSSQSDKYRDDDEWREAKKAKNRDYYHVKAQDPAWREKNNDRQRRARARKKPGRASCAP